MGDEDGLAAYTDHVCRAVYKTFTKSQITDSSSLTPNSTIETIAFADIQSKENSCSTCDVFIQHTGSQLPQFCTDQCTDLRFKCKPCAPENPQRSSTVLSTCATCHEIRHRHNLSPKDILINACGTDCAEVDIRVAPIQRDDGVHFVLRAVIDGVLVRILIDTGATTNFISKSLVNNHGEMQNKLTDIKQTSVRLGNASVELINQSLTTQTWVSDTAYDTSFLLMKLPAGIDAILGMGWMTTHNLWLHPATKRIVGPDSKGRVKVLTHLAEFDEDDDKITKLARLHEQATRAHVRDGRIPPSKHDKQEKQPLGMSWISKDKTCEGYNVSSKELNVLMSLMQTNKLTHDVFDNLLNKQFSKAAQQDPNVDDCGQEFPVRWGGQNAMIELVHMDVGYKEHAHAHAAWLIEVDRPKDRPGKENIPHRSRPAAQEDHMHACVEERALALARTTDSESTSESDEETSHAADAASKDESVETTEEDRTIKYPEGFDPSVVDKTYPLREQWVKDLKGQRLKHFECQTPIVKHRLLPDDLLLDIRRRKDAPPLRRQYIKTAVHLLPHLREYIASMTAAGFIRPSTSPFSAPVLVIPKPLNADGTSRGFRLVTDYRALNAQVEPVQHHIPDVHQMYEKLRNANFISTLDLKNGYWNAGLTEESKRLTAFSTEFGTYEYNVVPQGLVCSAAHFQKWVETKLRKHGILFEHVSVNPKFSAGLDTSALFDKNSHYIGTEPIGIAKIEGESGFVAVYIDDLIVFSADEESHARHLLEVMQVCSDELLFLNTDKSHLFCRYTRYLGAVCGNGRLFMDPKKVEAILKMPSPKESQTQIREFLGNCSFYRRWIDSYARKTTPLTELLKDNAKGKTLELWTADEEKYEKVVRALKSALCSYPVLRQPNFNKPFVLYTDASKHAIGGVICQLIEGKMCAIHYVSRSLQGPELNYSVQEKEALGIIFCVKKFRKLILGSKFKIRCLTDHKSLECLTNSKEIAGRMSRWAMIMSEYNYQVEYIKGVTNTAADALSRLIAKPESAWTELKLEDVDADTEHPFLLLWPDVTIMVNACQYYPSSAANDGTHANDRELLLTFMAENSKWIATEDKLNSDHDDTCYERVLFSRRSIFTGEVTVMTVTKELYSKCKEFGILHKYLVDVHNKQASTKDDPISIEEPTDPASRPKRKLFAMSTVVKGNGPSPKKRKEDKRTEYVCSDGSTIDLVSLAKKQDISKFFIDAQHHLLYWINADGMETLCVPDVVNASGESIRYHLFMEMHDSPFYGHRGVDATYNSMRRKFYWKRMRETIVKYIKSCDQCQNNKIDRSKPKGLLVPVQVPYTPAQAYNMDFMTDLPKSYYRGMWYDQCWVFVDRCSHRTYTILTRKDMTAQECFELFIHEIVLKMQNGVPLELIGDRDKIFTSKFFDYATTRLGTNVRLSSARSQQTNGKAERKIGTLEEVLRNGVNYRQDNWTEVLDYALLALNDAPDPQLGGRSSLFYERGFNVVKPVDLVQKLRLTNQQDLCPTDVVDKIAYMTQMRNVIRDKIYEAERNYVAYYDARRTDDKTIKVGSLVRLNLDHIKLNLFKKRESKLNPLWYGPFRILAQPSPVSFTLQLPNDTRLHDTYHVSKLKLATDQVFSQLGSKKILIPTDLAIEGDYEIDKILDHDYHKVEKKWYYLISYKGYSPLFHSTWEPREHLDGAYEQRDAYDDKHGIVRVQESQRRSGSSSKEGGGAKRRRRQQSLS